MDTFGEEDWSRGKWWEWGISYLTMQTEAVYFPGSSVLVRYNLGQVHQTQNRWQAKYEIQFYILGHKL